MHQCVCLGVCVGGFNYAINLFPFTPLDHIAFNNNISLSIIRIKESDGSQRVTPQMKMDRQIDHNDRVRGGLKRIFFLFYLVSAFLREEGEKERHTIYSDVASHFVYINTRGRTFWTAVGC